MMTNTPILTNITSIPQANRNELYRWCDYIELRTVVHADHRFSRDGFIESIDESADLSVDTQGDEDDFFDEAEGIDAHESGPASNDRLELFATNCFLQLQWRSQAFGNNWPFTLDSTGREIFLKDNLNYEHYLYLQLLLSASLRYCVKSRSTELTRSFENISVELFRKLMPQGAEVHKFGAAHTHAAGRYSGNLHNKLTVLAKDIRGTLLLEARDFSSRNSGDGGLDLVAWHNLGDTREHIPIAFGQCGCTADGWPNKMLEASPARLASNLHVSHDWATYYFMPIDLSEDRNGAAGWQHKNRLGKAIVIDRLRLINLSDANYLQSQGMLAIDSINEAISMRVN